MIQNDVLNNQKLFINLSTKQLVDMALSRKEGILAANEALSVTTGVRTGRSPKDRFIVKDSLTANTVDWNAINQPISPEYFTALWRRVNDYLQTKDCAFISYLRVGAEDKFSLPVKVIT